MQPNNAPKSSFSHYLLSPLDTPSDAIEQDYHNINLVLETFGYPKLGDLSKVNRDSLDQTNACINSLLKQRQCDIEYRKEAEKRVRSLEDEKQKLLQTQRALEHKTQEQEKTIDSLKGQIKSMEKKIKSEKEKLQSEKDELIRRCMQMQSQQSQYQNEIRRREKDIIRLQEQFKWQDKLINVKNSIEVIQGLSSTVGYAKNPNEEVMLMITRKYEENMKELQNEAGYYQDCLKSLRKSILDIAENRRQHFAAQYRAEYGTHYDEAEFGTIECKFHEIKDALFNLPFDHSAEEITRRFQENLIKLKEYIQTLDALGHDLGIDKSAEERAEQTRAKLNEKLAAYTKLAKLQGTALRRFCSLCRMDEPTDPYKLISDQEFENMWKNIVDKKKETDS